MAPRPCTAAHNSRFRTGEAPVPQLSLVNRGMGASPMHRCAQLALPHGRGARATALTGKPWHGRLAHARRAQLALPHGRGARATALTAASTAKSDTARPA